MNRIKIILLTCLAACSFSAIADSPLRVTFDGAGCPTGVASDGSCGDGSDRRDVACRNNNGPVRWAPVSQIGSVEAKYGGLHNCRAHPNQGYYQCIVRGNPGDAVEYSVFGVNGCEYDPVIIIR